MAIRPGGAMVQTSLPTKSQLIPVLSKWGELGNKSQLGPVMVTIVAFFLMLFTADGEPYHLPGVGWRNWWTSNFLIVVAVYLTLVSMYFIYRLVGKEKPWWVLLAGCFLTGYCIWLMDTQGAFLWMYEFFHYTLAGGEPNSNLPFLQLFVRHFLGTGFFEELFKAMPLLALLLLAKYLPPSLREKLEIKEPLDGILLGAACGAGFAIMETLGQYVSRDLVNQWLWFALRHVQGLNPQQAQDWLVAHMAALRDPRVSQAIKQQAFQQIAQAMAAGRSLLGFAPGLPGLIVRSIDLATGHMAYSGYFGYFIGLSVLRPHKRWQILGIGLVSASIPHALWDSLDSIPLQVLVAAGSYAILAAAILKAREMSPNRALLQPSIVFGALNPQPAGAAAAAGPAPAAAAPPAAAAAAAAADPLPFPAPASNLPAGTPSLRIGSKHLVIVSGLRLLEHQVPGLHAQSEGGPVAEVTRNPRDPSILGLTNLSTTTWEVVSPGGTRRELQNGQTIKLAPGTKINFGTVEGEVA